MAGDEKKFQFRAGNDVCRAQAYVPVGADGAQRCVRFDLPRISYIFEGDEAGTSRIRLDSGLVIPVRLSLEDLDAALHTPDVETVKDGIIDLTSVTQAELSPAKDLSPVIAKPAAEGENVTPKVVGDVMEDGTIYAGISPKTNCPFYVLPSDAPAEMAFSEAERYIQEFRFAGRSDFRLPTQEEFDLLQKNMNKGALKSTFNKSSTCYWSSTAGDNKNSMMIHYFYNGSNYSEDKNTDRHVRLVRSEGKIKISIPQPGR